MLNLNFLKCKFDGVSALLYPNMIFFLMGSIEGVGNSFFFFFKPNFLFCGSCALEGSIVLYRGILFNLCSPERERKGVCMLSIL